MNTQELRDAIVAELEADATLQSLLGTDPMKLFYNRPRAALADHLPSVTYSVVTDAPNLDMDTYGDFEITVQFDVWSVDIDTAEAVQEAISKALWDDPASLTTDNYKTRRVRRTASATIFTGVRKDNAEIIQVTQSWTLQVSDKGF